MKNEAAVKIKKRVPFQTPNRLRLPDVSFCFSEDSADAKVNIPDKFFKICIFLANNGFITILK